MTVQFHIVPFHPVPHRRAPPNGRRPPDEPVPWPPMPRPETPRHARHRPIPRIDQVLEVFADRARLPEIVVTLQQTVEQLLLARASDLADRQRQQRWQRTRDRGLVHEEVGGGVRLPRQRIRRELPLRWPFDVSGAMPHQHQAAAQHVTPRAVGLPPIPGLADQDRKLPAAGARVLRDELADRCDIGRADRPAAERERFVHARQGSRRENGTHVLFSDGLPAQERLVEIVRHSGAIVVRVGSPFHSTNCRSRACSSRTASAALSGHQRNRPFDSRF